LQQVIKKIKKPSGNSVIIEFKQLTNKRQEVPRWQKDEKRISGKRANVKNLQESLSRPEKSMLRHELKRVKKLLARLADF